jgi:hypothetical protein
MTLPRILLSPLAITRLSRFTSALEGRRDKEREGILVFMRSVADFLSRSHNGELDPKNFVISLFSVPLALVSPSSVSTGLPSLDTAKGFCSVKNNLIRAKFLSKWTAFGVVTLNGVTGSDLLEGNDRLGDMRPMLDAEREE